MVVVVGAFDGVSIRVSVGVVVVVGAFIGVVVVVRVSIRVSFGVVVVVGASLGLSGSMQLYATPIVLQEVRQRRIIIFVVVAIKVAYCTTVVEATPITGPRP